MFACLIVFQRPPFICLHASLCCPQRPLRQKKTLAFEALIQFCPIYILAVSHINTFIPGGYGNSAIEKKTRHVNDSLQDFNSGIPSCFKAGLEMIPSFIDMHHQIQFTLSWGMVWQKQKGSSKVVQCPQILFPNSVLFLPPPKLISLLAPWHFGTLAPWHIISIPHICHESHENSRVIFFWPV